MASRPNDDYHHRPVLAAAVVEILPIPVDDNFRIPLLAGLVLEWLR